MDEGDSTILFMIMLQVVLIALNAVFACAAENFSGVLVDFVVGLGVTIPVHILDSIAVVLITIILSYFTLVFGELVPKQVAMRKAEVLALALSGVISGIAKAFAPLVSFLTLSTNGVLRLMICQQKSW